jgi:hypothetical protein
MENGYRLGSWVADQRKRQDLITPRRKLQLEGLHGWVWNAIDERWEEGFRNLKAYSEVLGNTSVPGLFKTLDGYRLGGWVSEQRKRRDRILPERKVRLESLPGWVWDVVSERWEKGFCYLQNYVEQHGNAKVLGGYKTDDGFLLGGWVSEQRQ